MSRASTPRVTLPDPSAPFAAPAADALAAVLPTLLRTASGRSAVLVFHGVFPSRGRAAVRLRPEGDAVRPLSVAKWAAGEEVDFELPNGRWASWSDVEMIVNAVADAKSAKAAVQSRAEPEEEEEGGHCF